MCVGVVEIWFAEITNEQISSIFDSHLPATRPYFRFRAITSVNVVEFSRNLVCSLIL